MSRAILAIALLGLVAVATAYDISRVRSVAPAGWVRLSRADPRQVLPFRIALKQRNIDVLEVRTALDRVALAGKSHFCKLANVLFTWSFFCLLVYAYGSL